MLIFNLHTYWEIGKREPNIHMRVLRKTHIQFFLAYMEFSVMWKVFYETLSANKRCLPFRENTVFFTVIMLETNKRKQLRYRHMKHQVFI